MIKIFLLFLLRIYKIIISPVLGTNCCFYPSCAHYAIEAINQHGVWRGGVLSVIRLCRCHPWWCTGGFDPVPTTLVVFMKKK